MITQVKYLPKDELVPGSNPIQVTYDNGNRSVFNYVERHPLYQTIKDWEDEGNTIAPADS